MNQSFLKNRIFRIIWQCLLSGPDNTLSPGNENNNLFNEYQDIVNLNKIPFSQVLPHFFLEFSCFLFSCEVEFIRVIGENYIS